MKKLNIIPALLFGAVACFGVTACGSDEENAAEETAEEAGEAAEEAVEGAGD